MEPRYAVATIIYGLLRSGDTAMVRLGQNGVVDSLPLWCGIHCPMCVMCMSMRIGLRCERQSMRFGLCIAVTLRQRPDIHD